MNRVIKHLDWGLIDYEEAWGRQQIIFSETVSKKKEGYPTENHLVFCEHPHVYTLGKRGDSRNMLPDCKQLQANDVRLVYTDRGGDITYHGPGQLVGYPIFDLSNFGIGLKDYVHQIETCIIKLLEKYGIPAETIGGAIGVWLDAGGGNVRKICAVGVRSSRYVTMHGFALNVNTDLSYFNHINPCGFTDKGVTSLEKELKEKQSMASVKTALRKIFEKNFMI